MSNKISFVVLQNTMTDFLGFRGIVRAKNIESAAAFIAKTLTKKGYKDVRAEGDTVYFTAWFHASKTHDHTTRGLYPVDPTTTGEICQAGDYVWNTHYMCVVPSDSESVSLYTEL